MMKWEAQEPSKTLGKAKKEIGCSVTIQEIYKYFLSGDFLRLIFPVYNNCFS